MIKIQHPAKVLVPLSVGLAWGNDGAIYQEKLDGKFAIRKIAAGMMAGEQMADGRFIAWDCLAWDGDLRGCSSAARLSAMRELCMAADIPQVESSPDGGKLLQAVLARGGEGVVRKLPTATYYDAMEACKRESIWTCRITSIGPGQSVGICDAATGQDLGKMPLLGGKCDQVRMGSVIRVAAMEQHESGKLRHAKPCREWMVKL